jgi:lactoylglutathione lyase
MKLHHVAFWTRDIDNACAFWQTLFDARPGAPYESARRPGFRSCFLDLPDGQAVEVMQAPWLGEPRAGENVGYAHIALSAGSTGAVDRFAERAREADCLHAEPRWTGDGYYETVVVDPDGNLIEVTV